MASGFMTISLRYPGYWVELQGSIARVWTVNDESPAYDGPIDGIRERWPELWQRLLDDQAIKPA